MKNDKALGVLKVGDRVRIKPEWQDEGDDEFECLVIEAPTDSNRVRIRIIIPGLIFQPTEWIEADHLILINANSNASPGSEMDSGGFVFT